MPTSRRRPPRGTPAQTRPEAPAGEVVLYVRHFPRALADELRGLAARRRVRIGSIIAEAVRVYLKQAPDWRTRP